MGREQRAYILLASLSGSLCGSSGGSNHFTGVTLHFAFAVQILSAIRI